MAPVAANPRYALLFPSTHADGVLLIESQAHTGEKKKRMPEIVESSHLAREEWGLFASIFFSIVFLSYPIRTYPKPGSLGYIVARGSWNKGLGF